MTFILGYQERSKCLLVSDLLVKFYPNIKSYDEINAQTEFEDHRSPKILVTTGGDLIGWAGHRVINSETAESDLRNIRIEDLLIGPLVSIESYRNYPYNHLICASRKEAQLYRGDTESVLIPFEKGEIFCAGEAYQFDEDKSKIFRDGSLEMASRLINSTRKNGRKLMQELSNVLYGYMFKNRNPSPDNIRGFESYYVTPNMIEKLSRVK